MLNINKVRRIVKARFGLSIPSGNPYMTTNGMAIPGNSITLLIDKDRATELRNMSEQLMASTDNLIDLNAEMGDPFSLKLLSDRNTSRAMTLMNTYETPQKNKSLSGNWSAIGLIADFAGNIIGKDKNGYFGKYGTLLQTGDLIFDWASNAVMGVNPLVGGIMKVGGLASDILTKFAGMGTDSMTKTDAILGSKLLSLTPIGMVNGFFGKRTRDFSANKATIEQVGGSYGGTVQNINKASEKAGKKYGLFSSGSRNRATKFINRTESLQSAMTDIAKDALDLSSMATDLSDLNHMQYGFNLNGGYDLRYMRAAKFGAKLKRVKRVNFSKLGGEIVGAINLDSWKPVITEAVEQFENGGELEWTPVITLLDGGLVEKWDFETWFNSIPSLYRAPQYDYLMAFNVLDKEILKNHAKDPNQFHLPSVSGIEDKDERIPFLKLGKRGENKEVDKEFTEFYEHNRGKDFRSKYDVIYDKDRYYYVPKKFLKGGKTEELLNLAKEYYKDYDLSGINLIEDKSPRTEGNNLYVSNDEDTIHELWHYLSKNKPNEKYKEFYDNLDDERIKSLGGDLDFVKRIGDPGIFYQPSELEARIMAAKYKSKGVNYTKDFFKALRNEDENKYGYNMRDLLHMYNDENLEKIFNLKNGGELSKGEAELEETNLKNLIPEGALHAHKHHMENADNLTKKGIPVVDNDGEQLAEIERDEIIFTLEVTKALEDLYSKYFNENSTLKDKDEAAIEAGKLLVYEILYNTDDRTNLISKCKEGGILNDIK